MCLISERTIEASFVASAAANVERTLGRSDSCCATLGTMVVAAILIPCAALEAITRLALFALTLLPALFCGIGEEFCGRNFVGAIVCVASALLYLPALILVNFFCADRPPVFLDGYHYQPAPHIGHQPGPQNSGGQSGTIDLSHLNLFAEDQDPLVDEYEINPAHIVCAVKPPPSVTGTINFETTYMGFLQQLEAIGAVKDGTFVDDSNARTIASYTSTLRYYLQNLDGWKNGTDSQLNAKMVKYMHYFAVCVQKRHANEIAHLSNGARQEVRQFFAGTRTRDALSDEAEIARAYYVDLRSFFQQLTRLFHCEGSHASMVSEQLLQFSGDTVDLDVEADTVGVRKALTVMRDFIFTSVCEQICRGGSRAVTYHTGASIENGNHRSNNDSYYRKVLGDTYGIPNDVSKDNDQDHLVDTNHRGVFQPVYNRNYTVGTMVTFLKGQLSNSTDSYAKSGQFLVWLNQKYNNKFPETFYDVDGNPTTEPILLYLLEHKIIRKKGSSLAALLSL